MSMVRVSRSISVILSLGSAVALAQVQSHLPAPTDPAHPIPDVAPPDVPSSPNKPLADRPGKSAGKSADQSRDSKAGISLGGLDANGDGRLSRKEVSGNAGLKSRFGKLDTNGDGYLSPDEYAASVSGSTPSTSGSADVQGKPSDKLR
jgi:hypothetical protein